MLNILLAEDNKVDETALKVYLKNNLVDHTILTVPSCKELIKVLEGGELFDIIILDHILEDEQSLKYIEKIKSKSQKAEIIVLSGQTDISVCIQYLNSGVFAYLNKENNAFKNLVKNINEILAKREGGITAFKFNKPLIFIGIGVLIIVLFLVFFFR